jgi:hypothetical protein
MKALGVQATTGIRDSVLLMLPHLRKQQPTKRTCVTCACIMAFSSVRGMRHSSTLNCTMALFLWATTAGMSAYTILHCPTLFNS